MSERVSRLENVRIQWAYEKSDPDKVFKGKPMPRGKLITVSLGQGAENASEIKKQIREAKRIIAIEDLKKRGYIQKELSGKELELFLKKEDTKEKINETIEELTFSFKALKTLKAELSPNNVEENTLEFKITTFKDGEEKTRCKPVIIEDGYINEDRFPRQGDIADVEYVIKPIEFGGTYHLTPILKNVIVRQRSTWSSNKNEGEADLSSIHNHVATVGKRKPTDNKETIAEPKQKKTIEDIEEDENISEDEVGLFD